MNYIGSKLSLIDFIKDTILEVSELESGGVFADLFAGTGVVGKTFRSYGCDVISNDIQYYSYVLNRHLIENSNPIDISEYKFLWELDGKEGFVYKNYCMGSGSERNYFTDENGKKCDSIRIELENLREKHKISEDAYYYLLASLINSIDKYANTASVYGAFLKKIKKSASKEFKLELLPVIKGNKGKVYNLDINCLIKNINGDILYLDPPYNTRQYCSNYHVLETISKYDNPILKGKTGLREYSEQKSNYCSKRTALKAFDELIKNAKFKYIFLSYNNEGIMSVDEIQEVMKKYGKYELFAKNYNRFKADKNENRNYKSNNTVEYLHCLVK